MNSNLQTSTCPQSLPDHVHREFTDFPGCGLLEHAEITKLQVPPLFTMLVPGGRKLVASPSGSLAN